MGTGAPSQRVSHGLRRRFERDRAATVAVGVALFSVIPYLLFDAHASRIPINSTYTWHLAFADVYTWSMWCSIFVSRIVAGWLIIPRTLAPHARAPKRFGALPEVSA